MRKSAADIGEEVEVVILAGPAHFGRNAEPAGETSPHSRRLSHVGTGVESKNEPSEPPCGERE